MRSWLSKRLYRLGTKLIHWAVYLDPKSMEEKVKAARKMRVVK